MGENIQYYSSTSLFIVIQDYSGLFITYYSSLFILYIHVVGMIPGELLAPSCSTRSKTVFMIKILGVSGLTATAGEQIGYSIADVVARAYFDILFWPIAADKSKLEPEGELVLKRQ